MPALSSIAEEDNEKQKDKTGWEYRSKAHELSFTSPKSLRWLYKWLAVFGAGNRLAAGMYDYIPQCGKISGILIQVS